MRKVFLVILLLSFSLTAEATLYKLPAPGNDIVGSTFVIKVQKGDNFNKLTMKYEVSFHELLEANPKINPKKLFIGQSMVIPAKFILPKDRKGIVINIPELRLYYFLPDEDYVFTTPVGLGRSGWRTPDMSTRVLRKVKDPTWTVPKSIREYTEKSTGKILPAQIPPGPDNPLGGYALYLARSGYLLHGTNYPTSVGKYSSSGCIRLYSDAIATLYSSVPTGTPVHIIHHPDKAGWSNGKLYLESHMSVSEIRGASNFNQEADANSVVETTVNGYNAMIDWYKVDAVAKNHLGIPTAVGKITHVS